MRFAPGAPVRVAVQEPERHCRTPLYLRGKRGRITTGVGAFRNPAQLAFHKPGLPTINLYRVLFAMREVWPDYAGPATDTLEADLYENWLLPDGDAA